MTDKNPRCFVIQPFDNGNYDKRYKDVFQPAIQKADLTSYRIDNDLSVKIPIDEIEKGISECLVCFAEISTDNPNVWYELGYAFAMKKDVVMVCSDERKGKYPFDIQHRHIINYTTGSKSDFECLEEMITKKLNAIRQSTETVNKLNLTPLVATQGLESHEIALLVLITQNVFTKDQFMTIHQLQVEMNKSGYTDIATSVGLISLQNQGLVEVFSADSQWGNNEPYPVTKQTETGKQWILNNQRQLIFRQDIREGNSGGVEPVDDLPF